MSEKYTLFNEAIRGHVLRRHLRRLIVECVVIQPTQVHDLVKEGLREPARELFKEKPRSRLHPLLRRWDAEGLEPEPRRRVLR